MERKIEDNNEQSMIVLHKFILIVWDIHTHMGMLKSSHLPTNPEAPLKK